ALCFHNLFHMGGVPRRALSRGTVPFAILLTGNFRRFTRKLVWSEASLVAGGIALVARAAHSLGSGRFSADLLLLSRRLLQSVLGRSTVMHSRRASESLSRRTFLPSDPPECSSLFPLPGPGLPRLPGT